MKDRIIGPGDNDYGRQKPPEQFVEATVIPDRLPAILRSIGAKGVNDAADKVVLEASAQVIEQLLVKLHKITRERDEADRRAGAAERELAGEKDGTLRRNQWLDKAKRDAGYPTEESFDVVWEAALTALKDSRGITSRDWQQKFLQACQDEIVRGNLTSMPRKVQFMKDRDMKTIEEVHDWMKTTRETFEKMTASGINLTAKT